TAKNLRLNLPHFPNLLRSRLYSREGQLIGYQSGAWANISYVVGTQVASVNLKVRGHKDISVRKINKRVNQGPIVIGKYDHGAAGYLKDKLQLKELDNLESKGQFVFFPGSNEDRLRARDIIGQLLSKASGTCMILDPYFGMSDLFYAYLVESTNVPIQIISSAAFLKKKWKAGNGKELRQAELLQNALNAYNKKIN